MKATCLTIRVLDRHLDTVLERILDKEGDLVEGMGYKKLSAHSAFNYETSPRKKFVKDLIWQDRGVLAMPGQLACDNLLGIMQSNFDSPCFKTNVEVYNKFMQALSLNIMRCEHDPAYAHLHYDDTNYQHYKKQHKQHLYLLDNTEGLQVADLYDVYDAAHAADHYLFSRHVINALHPTSLGKIAPLALGMD